RVVYIMVYMHLIKGESNGIIEMSFNIISLKEDETCRLPAILSHRNENDTRGTWSLLKKDEDYTIVITSNNIFFNGEFVIESLETTKMRGGHFYTMTLSNQLCVIELNRPVY